jgi:hypothetical protein
MVDAFFDNMEDFFSGNGYDIVDKKHSTQRNYFDNIGVFVMKICTIKPLSNE